MRRRGSHLPAGAGSAGYGRGINPQQEQRHAGFLGGEGQTAAGSEIQLAHLAPAFHDHRAQRRTAQGINRRAQQRPDIGNDRAQGMARRAAQFGPAIGLEHAAQAW